MRFAMNTLYSAILVAGKWKAVVVKAVKKVLKKDHLMGRAIILDFDLI